MKKRLSLILAALMILSSFYFAVSVTADESKIYEKATNELIAEYYARAMALKDEIMNTKTEVTYTGTAYYISPYGNDANDGLTPDTAWRSPSKISGAGFLKEGDAVLFERGGVYRFIDPISTKNGVTYSAYGTGAKPKLVGSIDASAKNAWNKTDAENVYVYREAITRDVGNIVFDLGICNGIKMQSLLDNGTVSNGLETFKSGGQLIKGPADLKNDLEYWHDPDSKLLYLKSDDGAPADRFISIELVDYGHGMKGEAKDVTIDNLAFFGFGSHAIGYGSGVNLKVQNCAFSFIGGSRQGSDTGRFGNAVEIYGGCDGYVIDHCYADNVYDCCWTVQHSNGAAESSIYFKDTTFTNNVAMYSNSGPEVWLGETPAKGFEDKVEGKIINLKVSGNYTLYSGYGWSHQRPNKDGNFVYGGTGATTTTYENVSFDNNVGMFASWALYYARYTSPTGYNFNNNTYFQHVSAGYGGIPENPYDGTGGIGGQYKFTEENVLKFTGMGLEPGSKFYYVDADYAVPHYTPTVMTFEDVAKEHWAYQNIEAAVMMDWFKGTSETTFSPDMGMTRAMLVTVLSRITDTAVSSESAPFTDVSANAWFAKAVKWAYNAGVVEASDKFRPDEMATREEMADMLYRFTLKQYKTKSYEEEGKTLTFSDASSVTPEYAAGIAFAVDNGIIAGYPDGSVKPKGGATRAEVATMIKRFVDFYKVQKADYSSASKASEDKIFFSEDLNKASATSGVEKSIIDADINPALRLLCGGTNSYTARLSVFERFLNTSVTDYPYIKIRYNTNIGARQIKVGISKAGTEADERYDITQNEWSTILINTYELFAPDGSAELSKTNGSLVIKPWGTFGEWGTEPGSYFDIDYIGFFTSLEAAENYKSDFEANSALLTFTIDGKPFTSVAVRVGEKFNASLATAPERQGYKFDSWSIADGTVIESNTTVEANYTKVLGEPVALYTVENSTSKAWGGLESDIAEEDGIKFFRYKTTGEGVSVDGSRAQFHFGSEGSYNPQVNKIMRVGFRANVPSSTGIDLNFNLGNNRRIWGPTYSYTVQGKWVEVNFDLSALRYTGGESVQSGLSATEYFETYFTGKMAFVIFKPYINNGLEMTAKDTFDVAYIAFFDSVEDANAFKGFEAIKK